MLPDQRNHQESKQTYQSDQRKYVQRLVAHYAVAPLKKANRIATLDGGRQPELVNPAVPRA